MKYFHSKPQRKNKVQTTLLLCPLAPTIELLCFFALRALRFLAFLAIQKTVGTKAVTQRSQGTAMAAKFF
jgi:hypothetical protein